MMHAIVGNSPSSGSTLLGDLLDSTPVSVCGPELNLYTHSLLLADYEAFVQRPFASSLSPAIYTLTNAIYRHRLPAYALDEDAFRSMARKSGNTGEFLGDFGARFSEYREKPDAVWFEKTPQNISIAKHYLDQFPDSYFIHILRNPVYVANSLCNRGFPAGIAVLAWLFEVASIHGMDNNKVITIHYEDLVQFPWKTVAHIIQCVCGQVIAEDIIKDGYENNRYRQRVSKKQSSWEASSYGKIIDANKKPLNPHILQIFNRALNCRISRSWSHAYGLPELGYRDALRRFGYEDAVMKLLDDTRVETGPVLSGIDQYHLCKKHLKEFLYCHQWKTLSASPVVMEGHS